jgi:hypothetical protein
MTDRRARLTLALVLILAASLACGLPSAAPSPTPPGPAPAEGASPEAPTPPESAVPPTAEPTLAPTPTIAHLTRPSEPGSLQSFMTDYSSLLLSPEHRTLTDNYDWSFLERPFTSETMDYQPQLDLIRGELSLVPPWIYITLFLEDPPAAGDEAVYAVEIDLDIDGRGDWLITAALPQAGDWSTDRVVVYRDDNNDVGGVRPLRSDAPPQASDGFETLVFDAGVGPDPDAAWARIPAGAPDQVQIAFKHELIASDTHLLWGAWAEAGTGQPGWFDYNDHFTLAEAGSPLSTSPDYPLDQLASIDNTCRWAYDFVPTEQLPGMCALPATPTPVLLGSISGTVWLDMNANGTRNPGEGGMAGVTVSLRAGGCGGSVVATTTTAADGSYSFTNLTAGSYCVSVSLSCSSCSGYCSSPGSSNPRSLSLAGGEDKTGVDFGFYLQGPC